MYYSDQIREMADVCSRDPAFIDGIKDAFAKSGLASILGYTIDESKLDPHRPCPANWTAFQIAYFDNGKIEPGRNRPKIQRTKMRFGANIMVWTRNDIKFADKSHLAWQANIYLWTADEARQIALDLFDEKYIDESSVRMVADATSDASDDMRFSIPLFKANGGTRWMRNHLFITLLENDRPKRAAILFPHDQFGTSEPMVDFLADGAALSGKCIAQARIARNPSLGQWATELIS